MQKQLAVGLVASLVTLLLTVLASSDDRPNIVFMLSDDQGWNGTSVAMHPQIADSRGQYFHTPNLERLASHGMRFSQAYAPAPVCSPTRISLQTGKSPAQVHWTKAAPAVEGMKLVEPKLIKNIADQEVTIAELMQAAGYATAHYGKWHIGGGGPGRHGYDEHDGDTGNENAFKFEDPNPVDIFGMAERARSFMANAKQAGKPFFIQLSWNALHASENAMKSSLAKYQKLMEGANEKAISTAAITEDLDQGVGKVLDAIDQLGLAESTYVIYMSDNGAGGGGGGAGGGGRKSSLRGGKGGVWEGGLRVPLIVRGPGVERNSWSHVPVVGYDWFPTFCQWAQIEKSKLPQTIEGGDLTTVLTNKGQGTVDRLFDGLCFHFPHYQSEGPQSSILVGQMKLVRYYESKHDALFDLSKDIGERSDLSKTNPQQTQQLGRQLDAYLLAVKAQLPSENPNYDPDRQPGPDARRGNRGSNKSNKPKGNGK